jgi:hypothetical protein
VLVDIETAAGLDAVAAPRAVLPPVDTSKFADPVEAARCWNSMDMISIRHFFPRFSKAFNDHIHVRFVDVVVDVVVVGFTL